LAASSAIRDERADAEKAPEKTRYTAKRSGRFEKKEQYDSIPFQGAPVKERQEIDVIIDDIGSLRIKIISVRRTFAIAEKIESKREEKL